MDTLEKNQDASAPDELEAMILKAKNADEEAPPTQAEDKVAHSDTITVPRAVLNYVVIALIFFALGGVLGSFVFPSNSNAALPDNFEVVVREAVNDALETAGLIQERGLVMGESYDIGVDLSGDPFLGNPDAPVTIIEFSDFTCGFCGRFAADTLEPLLEEYGDQVKLVYMDFPFLSQMSLPTAMAGECANDQGQFWEMHDALFANQQGISPDRIRVLAEDIGLEMETFNTCFDENVHMDKIRANLAYGQELGVSGTPAFFINGRFVSGAQPITVFRQFIDEELSASS